MQNKKTVLFITGKYTREVADAVSERLNEIVGTKGCGIVVNQRELTTTFNKYFVDKIFPFENKARRFLRNLYLRIKEKSLNKKPIQTIGFKKMKSLHKHTLNVINRYNPDLVAVTSSAVLEPTLSAIHKQGRNTKVVVICDGFVLDNRLINRNVDYYFVDNFDMRNKLIEGGISEDRIEITPLPLKKSAIDDISKEEARKKMGIEGDKKIVLVSTGIDGDDRFKKVIEALADAQINANIIIACGKNVSLINLARNKGLIAYNDGIKIHIALSGCDLLITKPISTLIAEAIYRNKLVFGMLPANRNEAVQLDYLATDTIVKIADEKQLIEKVIDYIGDLEAGNETKYAEIFNLLEGKEHIDSAVLIAEKLLNMVIVEEDFIKAVKE
jgi:hypothetical protein